MKTSILSASILAALAAAPISASADVKIYGSVQAEYSNEDLGGQASETGIDDNALRSRIGFKATEKLGNGLSAIALLEFQVNPTDTTANVDDGGLSDRQQYVGLKHEKWGFIALGTFKSPYRTTGERLDPFYETNLQGVGAGAFSASAGGTDGNNVAGSSTLGHTGFVSSAIYYRSPTWNHLTLDVVFSPDEKDNGSIATNNTENGDANDYAFAVNYDNGPLTAFIAYGENSINDGSDESALKLGGSYNLGAHTLSGQYEWIEDSSALGLGSGAGTNVNGVSNFSDITAGDDGEVWFLGYQFKTGNNTFVAQYGQTESDAAILSNDSEYFALGMIHNFSKRTKIFAGYSETDGDNGSLDREVFSVGLRKDF